MKWNEEWVVPHRLLKKRLLLAPGQENGAAAEISSSKCEWLVKWRGLDYINATWELDTSLGSAVGQNLIKEYENRHKKALGDPSADKVIMNYYFFVSRPIKFSKIISMFMNL